MEEQEREGGFCPSCGKKVEEGSLFCEFCGCKLSDGSGGKRPPVKRKYLLIGAIAAIILAVALISGAIIARLYGNSGRLHEVFYVKDESLYGVDLKDRKKQPVEYTDEFLDSGASFEDAAGFGFQFQNLKGNCYFIPRNVNGDTYSLYIQKRNETAMKLDGGIQGIYKVTNDNRVVYGKNGNLYVNDGKERRKIDSEVSFFQLSQNGESLIWLVAKKENEVNCYDIYFQDLIGKEEKRKLAGNCLLWKYSEDLKRIFYIKNEILYLVKDQEKSQKLEKYPEYIIGEDSLNSTFFYTAKSKIKMADLVEDDLETVDSTLKEPDPSDYMVYTHYAYGARYVQDEPRYRQALDDYMEKQDRDDLRRRLRESELDLPWAKLYFYENGDSRLISDKVFGLVKDNSVRMSKHTYVVYGEANDSQIKKISLSDLIARMKESQSREDSVLSAQCLETVKADAFYLLDRSGTKTELDTGGKEIVQIKGDVKSGLIYCLLKDQDSKETSVRSGEIYTVHMKNGSDFGKMEKLEEDVFVIVKEKEAGLYYLKDVNDEGVGELYCNGELILSDVTYGVKDFRNDIPESEEFLCVSDWNSENRSGSLFLVHGKEVKKIGDTVRDWVPLGKDSVVMLSDYDEKWEMGDLKYYNGKETGLIDTDVRHLYPLYK